MPKFKVEGNIEYGRLEDAYLETVVEAETQEAAIDAALGQSFSRYQILRYYISTDGLEVVETDEPVTEAGSEEAGGDDDED